MSAYTGKYHQIECHRLCNQKYNAENCQCQIANRPVFYENITRVCQTSGEDLQCTERAALITSSNNYKDCKCPLECDSAEFSYIVSKSRYPTLWHFDNYLKQKTNLSFEETKESVAKVEIGYSQMRQTVISEEKKVEFYGMVSSVGGILGLFLGLSFLSIVELVEILAQMVLIHLRPSTSSK